MSRPSFAKRDRDRAKKAKAEEKRQRRQAKAADAANERSDPDSGAAPAADGPSTAELLVMVEDVHRRYDAGEMTEDDFQAAKADLLARLTID